MEERKYLVNFFWYSVEKIKTSNKNLTEEQIVNKAICETAKQFEEAEETVRAELGMLNSYESLVEKYKDDPFRKALFTALGANELTRSHLSEIYNFSDDCIITEGLEKNWQTSTSRKVTRCAFNLYNGYTGEDDEEARFFSIYDVLDVDRPTRKKLLEAVQILFGER